MSKKSLKPVVAAIGAAFAGSMLLAGTAGAVGNPFGLSELNGGYAQIADSKMEGKCGGSKAAMPEGKCGGSKAAMPEGKCGTGKCGGTKAAMPEGKCGAAKCGANK